MSEQRLAYADERAIDIEKSTRATKTRYFILKCPVEALGKLYEPALRWASTTKQQNRICAAIPPSGSLLQHPRSTTPKPKHVRPVHHLFGMLTEKKLGAGVEPSHEGYLKPSVYGKYPCGQLQSQQEWGETALSLFFSKISEGGSENNDWYGTSANLSQRQIQIGCTQQAFSKKYVCAAAVPYA